jgi:TPP-dependent pyruvate/acetoin dehydrogenase alpha subunit
MTGAEAKRALRSMMLIRAFEETLAKRPDHGFQLLSSGEEAVAVGLCAALGPHDQLLSGGRSIGPALARGCDPSRVMAELLGRATGTNRGKGGRGHLADPASGFFGSHAVVGGNINVAAGVALSMQLARTSGIVAILFGDGAFGAGALHESLNIAASWKLPLLFICNNNQLSVSTPRATALAPRNLSDIGLAFGIPAKTTDGLGPRRQGPGIHRVHLLSLCQSFDDRARDQEPSRTRRDQVGLPDRETDRKAAGGGRSR